MNRLAGCALLACAAAVASGALHAQARNAPWKPPRLESAVPTEKGTAPCGAAGVACFGNVRSRAVALAWANGLDEHGMPLGPGARARKLTEMEAWLRRLAGTFRLQGTYRNHGGSSPLRGTAKCLGLGDGPGLSCLITATWKAPREGYKDPALDKGLYAAMQPLVLVLGIDPDASQIRATLMEQRALKMRGFLMEDEVAFSGELMTMDPLVPYTWDSSLIAIKPAGDVDIKFAVQPTDTRYTLEGMRLGYGQPVPKQLWIEFDLQLLREGQH